MKKRILAVASGGGHWEQLAIISSAFAEFEVVYATTMKGLPEKSGLAPAYIISDANRNNAKQLLLCTRDVFKLVRNVKPDIVISTGAAPGLLALMIGKTLGAKVIWIDSVANSEKLSLSGKVASKFANLCLTQWEHLAGQHGSRFMGSVL